MICLCVIWAEYTAGGLGFFFNPHILGYWSSFGTEMTFTELHDWNLFGWKVK